MGLTNLKELLSEADKGGYAVGAFNAVNMESVQATLAAAEAERAPLILQITETTIGQPGKPTYTGLEELMAMAKVLVEKATVPVAIHLDHGRTFASCKRCIDAGFTSVMIDGSLKIDGKTVESIDENIRKTKEIVEYARSQSQYVSVEGEIGSLGEISDSMSNAEKREMLTQPKDAKRFAMETSVDAVAIAFGTKHGPYKGKAVFELTVIESVNSVIDTPLVMHGGTGIPSNTVREAIKLGINKINIDTQIRMAFEKSLREVLASKTNDYMASLERAIEEGDELPVPKYDIRKILDPARKAMVEAIRAKMQLFGCSGKA
ncbi:class II fructose-bisphosphate aldolase [candidate division NPL-UPA2 bacterium Unc8]|uniref:Class II fructose-bisphosphate aldolase n=1 Tax=candidate division NPL-UPA2 bacterium Unc8 TaxID=1980939 RepID=A0A399FV56_UNCN2|nr:putative fructose-bisphosphate aldolase [Bacillota bacterium]RII00258.1 MAG: class II fructose-bisphosphate aldolase [candidate division NPL-UPA2 bacterium Unc8]